MLRHLLYFIILQAQNRGATKFNSSPGHAPHNDDYWNIARINTRTINRRISDDADAALALEPEVEQRKPLRRTRTRVRSTAAPATTTSTTTRAIEESTFGDYMRNVPVVRVRGRNRNKILENGSTPPSETSSIRSAAKKSPNSVASKEPSVSSRPSTAREETISTRSQRPSNHRNDDAVVSPAQQNANGRRIRVRVVQPSNAVANDISTTKNDMETHPRHRPKPTPQERIGTGPEEPNYPEHFKVLLKSKQTSDSATKPEDRRSDLFPAKKFQPKPATSSTTALPSTSEKTVPITPSRAPYKHKKIVRPNKLLFPSLQTSLTTSTTTIRSAQDTAAHDVDQVVAAPLEQAALLASTDGGPSPSTSQKSTPTTKFSSKIRNIDHLPSSGFKMRVVTTTVNGSQEIIAKNDQPPEPNYQRLTAVSFIFFLYIRNTKDAFIVPDILTAIARRCAKV